MSTHTAPIATPGWTVDRFAQFWANPTKVDPAVVALLCTEDVVGHWPGGDQAKGLEQYTEALNQILDAVPGMRLTVADHATNGDVTFVRWIMHAEGADGPFEMSGIDCLHLRDGLVEENFIRFDRGQLERLLLGS